MSHAKLVIIIVLCVSLGACSTKWAYNYLDWIIEWYISDYVTLDEDQEWLLGNSLEKSLTWHKTTQLPLYVASLQRLEQDLKTELTRDELAAYADTYNRFWLNIRDKITPLSLTLLATLSQEQIDELTHNLEQQNSELEEEYVNKPLEARYKQRTERMIERLEHWIDDLDPGQQRAVAKWSHTLKPISKRWVDNRRRWQQQFTALLYEKHGIHYNQLSSSGLNNIGRSTRRTKNLNTKNLNTKSLNTISVNNEFSHVALKQRDGETIDAQLANLFTNSRQFWSEDYARDFTHNFHATLDLFASVEQQLTTAQRNHLLAEIESLKKQLNGVR